MDWQIVINRLDSARLRKLCTEVDVDVGKLKKAELQRAVLAALDENVKESLLRALTVQELKRAARMASLTLSGSRKDEIVESFLEEAKNAAFEQEMAENPPPVDARRLDVVGLPPEHPLFDIVPTQPVGDDEALFDELSEQLCRPTLKRMVFISYVCSAPALQRLAGPGMDDLAEALCREIGDPDRSRLEPMLTLVLDRTEHNLGTTEAGRALVAVAQELPDFFQIRLGPSDRRLHAKVYLFEESHPGGAWLTGYVGSSNLTAPGIGIPGSTANIEANVRVAGHLGADPTPVALLHRWVEQLLDESQPLTLGDLQQFPADEGVRRKIRYKRDFDTAHEMRLKYLAELICRRGRFTWPLCDVSALHDPPDHQLAPVARSAAAGTTAFLLLDEVGLGKTVEAGLVLSRELRRRRERPDAYRRTALVLAPPAIHEQWKEELETKFNLTSEIFSSGHTQRLERRFGVEKGAAWESTDAQVVISSPDLMRNQFEDAAGLFDLVLVDEFHRARGPATHEALTFLCTNCELRILSSGTPIQNRLSELRSTFELTIPPVALSGEKAFADVFGGPDGASALRSVLLPFATRAFRRHLIGSGEGKIPARRVENLLYRLSTTEAETYLELRELRREYSKAGRARAGWAFITMEQMFLSSPHAFLRLASHIAGDIWAPPELDPEISTTLVTRDDSYQFLRQSRHYQRRLRTLGFRLREEASEHGHLSAKEQVFLRALRAASGQRVLVFTRFRATQQRLAAVVHAAASDVPIRQLNGSTPRSERARYLAWFTSHTRPVQTDRPAGVLICTDVAAEGLNLQQGCSVLINYDLPWNPQKIEQRIGRLQRWGQTDEVRVYNLQASNPLATDGWTMDTRVVEVCQDKFGLAEQSVGASEALLGLQPATVEELFAGSDAFDDALEVVSVRQPEELDVLFPGELADQHREAIRLARAQFHEYRGLVRSFWERVTNRTDNLAYAQSALFGRLQSALLQGHVGILRDAATPLHTCQRTSVLAGVRVIIEAVELEDRTDALEDVDPNSWLIEDELVRLWGARPGQAHFEASSWVLAGGIIEVLPDEAIGVVDSETLEFLLQHKAQLQATEADGAPLESVLQQCPTTLRTLLGSIREAGEQLAQSRLSELRSEWSQRLEDRNALFVGVRDRAEDRGLRKAAIGRLDNEIRADVDQYVLLRHEVRLTQLALVME